MKAQTRRFIDRHGESVTLRNYTQSGTDEYGDPTFTETTETTKAVFQMSPGSAGRDSSGHRENVSITARLSDTETVNQPKDNSPKGTVIERNSTGLKYKVESVTRPGNGLLHCEITQHEE